MDSAGEVQPYVGARVCCIDHTFEASYKHAVTVHKPTYDVLPNSEREFWIWQILTDGDKEDRLNPDCPDTEDASRYSANKASIIHSNHSAIFQAHIFPIYSFSTHISPFQ